MNTNQISEEVNADGVALVGAIAWSIGEFRGVLGDHLVEMDREVLPHLLMGAYVRHLAQIEATSPEAVTGFLALVEQAAGEAEGELRNVLALSLLEDLPDHMKQRVGPNLQRLGLQELGDSW